MANKSNKSKLDSMKMEVANELGIQLQQGYNGDLPSKQAGSIGGEMVKRMINEYKSKN